MREAGTTEAEKTFLEEAEWRARAEAHRVRLAPFVEEHLARRSRGQKHPVWDFLFEYYSFRPTHLMKWSPGIGVELRGQTGEFERWKETSPTEKGIALDPAKFPAHRVESLCIALEILEATAARPAFHGCFGLHEWAMVYRCPQVRHAVPLRLSDDEIAHTVETQTVRCSHYDAFRFFTPAAVPLNVLNPQSHDRAEFEQPGCIHANMDLYKWSYKFYPWISSDLVADALEVALFAREFDMRAAPYDLRPFGFEPIQIETVEGRREYQAIQREIAAKAQPVRARLIEAFRHLLHISQEKLGGGLTRGVEPTSTSTVILNEEVA